MQAQLSKRRRLGTFRLGETVAHNVPTGFWSLHLDDLDDTGGNSLADNLDMIWNGAGGAYKAADFALPYPDGTLWGNVGPGQTTNDVQPNIDAWQDLLDDVVNYNAANGTAIRVVISRELNGMVTGPPGWSITGQPRSYVDGICDVLNADAERQNVCMGWWLADDTFGSAIARYSLGSPGAYDPAGDVATWQAILDEVHTRQGLKGLNLPFYFDYNIHYEWPRGVVGSDWIRDGHGNVIKDTWFPPTASGGMPNDNAPPPTLYRQCNLNPSPAYSGWFLDTIRRQSDGGAFPDDAHRVLMPYQYPWTNEGWDYTVMPPWLYWKELYRALMAEFRDDADLQIQPMLASSQQKAGGRIPGHADMHKQIRVVLDIEELDVGGGQMADARERITGLWFAGWTFPGTGNPWTPYEGHAKRHWVSTSDFNEQWAEAIQTEIGDMVNQPTAETISAASPSETKLMSAAMDNTFTTGIRVPYQLATAGHVLIRVSQGSDVIREIEEGFGGKSPAGYYDRDGTENPLPADGSATRLRGTSAYWDGQKGDPDYTFQLGVYVPNGSYTVALYVDGVAEGAKTIAKP